MSQTPKRFSRLDPDTTANLRPRDIGEPRADKGSRVVEIILFSVFGLLFVVAGLALWAMYSPRYREVPNLVAEGMEQDRINVLVIGIGGPSHIGGGKDLADALILASFKPSKREVAMISIPRDLYVPIGRYGTHRINEAHRIGNTTTYPGQGPKLTMDTVGAIFNVPIHAFVRIDFAAFEKIVDQVGGIDVYVDLAFHDFLFNDGFEQGWQHLNGDRALRYARYRYVMDVREGTNFARERRQRQVIDALRKKMVDSDGKALNLIRAASTLSSHTATNLTNRQMLWFWNTFSDVPASAIQQVSLEPYVEIFDLETFAGAGEAVRTSSGTYEELREVANGIFREPEAKAATSTQLDDPRVVSQTAAGDLTGRSRGAGVAKSEQPATLNEGDQDERNQ